MFSSQGQQKKNVVLSGEAMKEMAKQAKANREERRLTVGLFDFLCLWHFLKRTELNLSLLNWR